MRSDFYSGPMTNLEVRPVPELCDLVPSHGPVVELHEARDVPLGGVRAMRVRRTLPQRALPLVGAWCFLDEFGPQHVDMRVLPHPHTGLQTVTWPVAGEILHRDSVGSEAVVRPGQLNLMTAGHGRVALGVLAGHRAAAARRRSCGWRCPTGWPTARPGSSRSSDLPVWEAPRARATVFIGDLDGTWSPAHVHTPLLGAEVVLDAQRRHRDPAGAAASSTPCCSSAGRRRSPGRRTPPSGLLYLGDGRDLVRVAVARRRAAPPARRRAVRARPRDVVELRRPHARRHRPGARRLGVRRDRADRFGVVAGHDGARIPAPELPNIRLQPRRRLPRTPKEPS